ncbi:SusE domain-containing protein [Balneolales bacterium ANBcel1]|nr:SusE domain-containing protein [Balneolales bacterium ANBcel1]
MKRFSLFTISMVLVFAFYSCDKDSGPVMSSSPGSASITSPEPNQSFVLTEDQADEELFTLEWSAADYGYDAAIVYSVQMSPAGDNFENFTRLTQTHETSHTFSVGQINSALISMGFQEGDQASVQFRILSELDGARMDEMLVSEPIGMAFSPYEVVIEYPELQVPGSHQESSNYGSNWSPDDPNIARLYSIDNDNQYEGYVYVAEDGSEFKFTQGASWDVNWGDDGADGTLQTDGANIERDAGYYKINVDLDALTYETLNTHWGLIGDATPDGWDADQDMTYDPDEHVWTITLDLTEGHMKFRANDDWALNYGDDGLDGELSEGGADIPIDAAGNYTVILDLSGPIYTYDVIMN